MRRPARYYSLRRPKLRQSWNKINLYNLAQGAAAEPMMLGHKTLFQQRWSAKSRMRGYHGEHIQEKKWKRIFSPRLEGAVDMPPKYLARYDGSEQAAGRGSGLTTNKVSADEYSIAPFSPRISSLSPYARNLGDINKRFGEPTEKMTPYMQMTFAPLERRLETAVFRAMFASSVRQARQFVIHGAVTVNGQKMRHPAYQLNPGDMFQVDMEKVLYATGEQKPNHEAKQLQAMSDAREKRTAKEREEHFKELKAKRAGAATATEGDSAESPELKEEDLTAEEVWKLKSKSLKSILKDVQVILKGRDEINASMKKKLRVFRQTAKRFLSHAPDTKLEAHELVEELQLQMKTLELEGQEFTSVEIETEDAEGITNEVEVVEVEAGTAAEEPTLNRTKEIEKGLEGLSPEEKQKAKSIMGDQVLTRMEMRSLVQVMKYDEENPIDDSKPYKTPWQPRPFMQAFAYIPRYLEVNHTICAAVYLRHPVARKGIAEVPTPFPYVTNQLAHGWYIRRGARSVPTQ